MGLAEADPPTAELTLDATQEGESEDDEDVLTLIAAHTAPLTTLSESSGSRKPGLRRQNHP